MDKLIIPKHLPSAGFFSCCSVILHNIIKSINNGYIPTDLDTTGHFHLYKKSINTDIRTNFFSINNSIQITKPDIPIELSSYKYDYQFSEYNLINFKSINSIINKYFNPSPLINHIINTLTLKYSINYENICVIRYRGTDKVIETVKPQYDEFISKALQVKQKYPSIQFLILTDETEFLNYCIVNLPECIYFKELLTVSSSVGLGVHMNYNASKDIYYFVASIFIASKCKYIITTSGNCDLWITLFRGNANGMLQYIHHKDYIYGDKNDQYTNTSIWYDNIL